MKEIDTIFALLCGHWSMRILSVRITFIESLSGVVVMATLQNGMKLDYVFEFDPKDKSRIIWPFKYKPKRSRKKLPASTNQLFIGSRDRAR